MAVWQQRSVAGGKHALGAAAGRDRWRAAPSQLVLWSPLQCLLSRDPLLSTPINICLLHCALPAYLGTCSHIPARSLHQPQGLLPRECDICGSGAWCGSCMTWDACFYHRQGDGTTPWAWSVGADGCLRGAALAAHAALWERGVWLGSCMAGPPVPGLPAWGCPCVALSPLPSSPQQGHGVGAKQKEAFGVGVGNSGERVQALPGRLTPFLVAACSTRCPTRGSCHRARCGASCDPAQLCPQAGHPWPSVAAPHRRRRLPEPGGVSRTDLFKK